MKEENVEMVDIHNSDSEGDVDQNIIENDNYNRKDDNYLNNDESLEYKGYRKFLVADYVEYCKNTNVSKCLIRNCEKPMSGCRTCNIKRHYHKVHNFVIVHGNKPPEKVTDAMGQHASSVPVDDLVEFDAKTSTYLCLFVTCNKVLEKELSFIEIHYNETHKVAIARDSGKIPNRFYRKRLYHYIHQPLVTISSIKNELLSDDELLEPQCSKELTKPQHNLQLPLGKKGFGKFKFANYVYYEKDKKISKCLIKHCERSMRGSFVGNIKRHYLTIHNFVILHGNRIPFNEFEELPDITEKQINELIIIDKNSPHECLFVNCNHILEKNLAALKIHYLEIHKVIIVKYSDYMVQKKLRYRDMLQSYEKEYFDDESVGSVGNEFLSDDDKGRNEPHTELTLEKIKYGKLIVDNYVDYQKDKNISKCLIKQCKRSMSGCFVGNIKRHYLTIHNFVILHGTRTLFKEIEEMPDITEEQINDLTISDKDSSHECLFVNCNHILEENLSALKRHYLEIHKVLIVRYSDYMAQKKLRYRDMLKSYEKEFFDDESGSVGNEFLSDDDKGLNKLHTKQQVSLKKIKYGKLIVDNYVDYQKDKNISKCLIKNCERSMRGCVAGNIKRHYEAIHNFIILHGKGKPFEELDISHNIALDDLSSYQCLFTNCNQVLEKHLPTIKIHYFEIHKVIFARDSDHKVQRNPRHREIYESHEFLRDESCSVRNEFLSDDEQLNCSKRSNINLSDYMDETESCFIKNEYISDDGEESHNSSNVYTYDTEYKAKPHCRKGSYMNLSDYMDETESCVIKNECISDDEEKSHNSSNVNTYDTEAQAVTKEYINKHDQPHPIKHCSKERAEKTHDLTVNKQYLQKKQTCINITLSKQTFFQLCLDLVIERDLPINLFDDEIYFKPLLAPYEQVFDCVINASVMQSIMLKANNIIVDDLTKTFTNKIVCLELHVVKRENNYYMIVNVRFLEEQTICNKLIGFLPVNETTKILTLAECLSKFNIKDQQVYMKTIIAELQEDEEIYKICNNLCKYNSDVKNHPIHELQTIIRTFMQKYSEDINTWQILSEYHDKSTEDTLTNLKKFAHYLEDWSKTDLKLQEAKYFVKALQICWDFMEKLNKEQYVAGDFYRDWLCCELGLKGEQMKHNNLYAAELYEDLSKCKNKLLESNEFIAALYLDARFNFLGSRLLSDTQKTKGKLFLCDIWEKFNNYLQTANSNDNALPNNVRDNDNSNDDEYALLTQHINDTMPVKSFLSIQHKLTSFIPKQRQPISIDILKHWHCNHQFMEDINELTKIVFTHSASHYILRDLQTNFSVLNKTTGKFDKFLMRYNQSILEKNTARILGDFN